MQFARYKRRTINWSWFQHKTVDECYTMREDYPVSSRFRRGWISSSRGLKSGNASGSVSQELKKAPGESAFSVIHGVNFIHWPGVRPLARPRLKLFVSSHVSLSCGSTPGWTEVVHLNARFSSRDVTSRDSNSRSPLLFFPPAFFTNSAYNSLTRQRWQRKLNSYNSRCCAEF